MLQKLVEEMCLVRHKLKRREKIIVNLTWNFDTQSYMASIKCFLCLCVTTVTHGSQMGSRKPPL